jgi:hypothetical protein
LLRLTLRSGRDGRLLARIVDRDGVAFVLDYGDPSIVADASRKVLHGGFRVAWGGVVQTVGPGMPHLLRMLAVHYAESGLLVAVDEPDWPRRAGVDPADVPEPLSEDPPLLLPDEWTEGGDRDDTEILSRRDLKKLKARLEAEKVAEDAAVKAVRAEWKPARLEPVTLPEPTDEEDTPTEELDVTTLMPNRRRP